MRAIVTKVVVYWRSQGSIEAKVVLARLLQRVTLTPVAGQNVHAHMGATLEPRPGVKMVVRRRP